MNWKYNIDIREFLTEDDSKESMELSYKGICSAIEVYPLLKLPDKFHQFCKEGIIQEEVEIFNLGLNHLYDWADSNRVWLRSM